MLRALGLDAVSERVYRALLADPTTDATLLAEQLGLSQGEVTRSLDTLADFAAADVPRSSGPTVPG